MYTLFEFGLMDPVEPTNFLSPYTLKFQVYKLDSNFQGQDCHLFKVGDDHMLSSNDQD